MGSYSRRVAVALGFAALGFAALNPAYAQEDAKTCAAIADAAARLACFDALATQPAAPAAPVAPSTAPGASNFGLPQRDGDETPELSAHVASAVEELQKGSYLTLDNGQVWKLLDNLGYYADVAAGTEVTIRTSFSNGYRMQIKGITSPLKVKRLK